MIHSVMPLPARPTTAGTLRLLALAVGTLAVPTIVLGRGGYFMDHSTDPASFSLGITAWLVSPYVAFAVLLVLATRSRSMPFLVCVVVGSIGVVVQSVAITAIADRNADKALGAVGVVAIPFFFLLGAALIAAVWLVSVLWARSRAPQVPQPGRS